MRRLELSRGLAASAVGALAVAGLTWVGPAGPAGAASPGVVFVSLHNQGNDVSVRYDGNDSSVLLVAQRLDPAATISFEYNANPAAGDASPGWTAIAGMPNVLDNLASLAWAPAPALLGKEVAVRAVATAPGGTTFSTRRGVVVARAEWGTESVTAARQYFGGGNIGYFEQPYASTGRTATRAAVPGTTSASSGRVQVGWWDPATRSLRGKVDAVVRPTELKVSPGVSAPGGGEYAADLDITAFGAAPGDAIAIAAELDTDEVHVTQLNKQVVGSIEAYANTQGVPAGQPAKVTVTVYDNDLGMPIAGAEVRRMSNGSLVGYTNGDGEVFDTGVAGALVDYYVNTTDTDAYEAGTDLTDTTAPYAPQANDADPVLRDGRVFDDDEYAAGDLALRLVDGSRRPQPGADVEYRVYRTGSTPPAAYQTATSDSQGMAQVAFSPQGSDGSYTLDFHLPAASDQSVTFTAGESRLTLTPKVGTAAPGGELTMSGALKVAGLPLSNRLVAATYKRGVELVPGVRADAALRSTTGRVLSLTSSTDPLGLVTYVVDDKSEKPQGAETGGRLSLSTRAPSAGGANPSGDPKESAKGTTAFGSKKGKAKVKLTGSSAGGKDRLVVKGPDSLRREKVTLFRVVGGKLKKVASKRLGTKGDTTFTVQDTNGGRSTTYLVKLASSVRVKGSKSKPLTLG